MKIWSRELPRRRSPLPGAAAACPDALAHVRRDPALPHRVGRAVLVDGLATVSRMLRRLGPGLLLGLLLAVPGACAAGEPRARGGEPAPGAPIAGSPALPGPEPSEPAPPGLDPASPGPDGAPLLLYGLLTRHDPFERARQSEAGPPGARRSPDPAGAPAAPPGAAPDLEQEGARGEILEQQIEAEVRRQQELLRQIDDAEARAAVEPALPGGAAGPEDPALADPRLAPPTPVERELPLAIFDAERAVVPAGTWDNPRELEVLKRVLDADRDGLPEQVRYYDGSGLVLLRQEQDTDYDGRMDAWTRYEGGQLAIRELDGSGDGKPDVFERYAGGRMAERSIDRDGDGVRDATYVYDGAALVEERHDPNNDGVPDRVIHYRERRRVSSEEDENGDGRFDTWTSFQVVGDRELAARIERDTQGRGKPDLFETYTAKDGKVLLAKREEDRDGDGAIDVTSFYEEGKLVRRVISDPSLVPR
jgi:hypothetical protein